MVRQPRIFYTILIILLFKKKIKATVYVLVLQQYLKSVKSIHHYKINTFARSSAQNLKLQT